MPAPDIITPLTTDPAGPAAWIWQDVITIDRQGQTPLVTASGTEDTWRVSYLARASLALQGAAALDPFGHEIAVPVPAGYESRSVDVAHLTHDPRVVTAIGLLREVLLDLHRGTLIPQPPQPIA